MRILGVDPGIALVGFGIVEAGARDLRAGSYGHISTESGMPIPDRLKILYDDISTVIGEYRPDVVAVEELFFNKNAKTAIVASHARGVIILAAVNSGLPVFEYTPLQVKQAVVGYGRASKQQVQAMVARLLQLKEVPKPDDTADALAVAICHANSMEMEKRRQ
jgi:crossover junction endodeoxyribonuclease RuvC